MNADDRYRHYQELQQYVGWTEEDAHRVHSVASFLTPHFSSLIDDFYAEIERHPDARKVITGGTTQIERLKETLLIWLGELFAGRYDLEYVARRWRVGWRHVEIGLGQVYTNVALSRLRRGLLRILEEHGPADQVDAIAVRRSLNTLLDLDLAIIEDAYAQEYMARLQRSERLAVLGQTAEEIDRLNNDLRRRVMELQTLLDVIPIGIGIADDAECRLIRVNPALANLLRIDPSANAYLNALPNERPPFRIFRNGAEIPVEELPLHQAARGQEVRAAEFDVVHPDGETLNLYGYAAPLLDEKGRPRGAVGAYLDITERKKQQERALQNERLAAIGQMMTGLAHESGNALARSQSCLEMLAWEIEDRPEAQDLIRRIQNAQDHLKQLYEEVRGYAATLKLDREGWNLSQIWRQTWENLTVARQGREAALCEQTGGIDLLCQVDSFRLDQVFRNIFDNSLAACRGTVRIDVTCTETILAGRPAVCVSLRDNGPGLTAEQRRHIFEPFFTTRAKGTGLGMAIAKRIMEAHGGQIAVGTAAAGGAEIILTIPREAP